MVEKTNVVSWRGGNHILKSTPSVTGNILNPKVLFLNFSHIYTENNNCGSHKPTGKPWGLYWSHSFNFKCILWLCADLWRWQYLVKENLWCYKSFFTTKFMFSTYHQQMEKFQWKPVETEFSDCNFPFFGSTVDISSESSFLISFFYMCSCTKLWLMGNCGHCKLCCQLWY